MEIAGDFHIHTRWCGHAAGEMEEYVARALRIGLPAIGFSAHFPVELSHREKVCLEPAEVELYVKEARRLRDAYRDDLDILMGFEVDYFEGREDAVRKECIGRWRPDYIMGSIHIIDDWPFDHPAYMDGYKKWKISDLYRTYFGRLEKLVESGLFDVLGHMDLVKKFGYRPEEDVSEAAYSVLDRVAQGGMLLDVNTAGFDKPVGEMYPSMDILKEACRRGILVTMGSDSHAPEEVGRHFDRAIEILAEAGFDRVVRPDRSSRSKSHG